MKRFAVVLAPEAVADIVTIHRHVATEESPARAAHVRDRLLESCRSLESLPRRGHRPPELERVGVSEFREVHWKPFRVIYEVGEDEVLVHAVLDGRRDLQDLLAWRLLR